MNTISTDRNGVPIIDASFIENKAEEIIRFFMPKVLDSPCHVPLVEIIEDTHKRFGVRRGYDKNLGVTKHGRKILGQVSLHPLGIYIDISLQTDPRFPFTLAHEIGHLVLHRKVNVKETGYEGQELTDTERDLVTGKKLLKTPRDWLEWQANRFASAILLPRSTIHQAVAEIQKQSGINRNIGSVILEDKPYSIRDYNLVSGHLQLVYGVSHTHVECRLLDLEILCDRRDIDVKHISELFMTE